MADDLTVEALLEAAKDSRRVGPNERWFAEHEKAARVLSKALEMRGRKPQQSIVDAFITLYPDCPTSDPQGIKRALHKLGY